MLKKTVLIERASTLNSATEGTLVLAMAVPELPGKQKCVAFACEACGADFASNPDSEPYCVNCGSEHVATSDEAQVPDIPTTDEDMVAVQCRNEECATFNIVHKATASTLKGVMHCVTCGEVLAYNNPFNDGGQDPADTRPTEGTPGTPADTRPTEGTPGTPADTRPEPTGNDDIDVHHAFEDDGGLDFNEEDADFDVADQYPLGEDPEVAGEPSEPLEPESVQDDDMVPAKTMAMAMASVVLANNAKASLELLYAKEKLYAMLDGIHVATLTKETAAENADILNTVSLSHTIKQVAQAEGVKAALKQFGFTPVKLNFPQGKVNAALVERKTKEVASKYYERADEIKEDYEQCVAIAATGLTRNFFAKHQNALKKGFSSALAAAGVKNADRLVASVFERYGDEYHRVLFEIAGDLMKKPVDIRNELADTLQQVSPAADQNRDEDVVNQQVPEDDIEARLEAALHPTVVPTAKRTLASVSSIADLREATGGSLFHR